MYREIQSEIFERRDLLGYLGEVEGLIVLQQRELQWVRLYQDSDQWRVLSQDSDQWRVVSQDSAQWRVVSQDSVQWQILSYDSDQWCVLPQNNGYSISLLVVVAVIYSLSLVVTSFR